LACLLLGNRYAARTLPLACLLSIGDRYAARTMPFACGAIDRWWPLRG
jgi:hypothetical protein